MEDKNKRIATLESELNELKAEIKVLNTEKTDMVVQITKTAMAAYSTDARNAFEKVVDIDTNGPRIIAQVAEAATRVKNGRTKDNSGKTLRQRNIVVRKPLEMPVESDDGGERFIF